MTWHDNNLQFTASLKNHNTLTASDIHWCHSFVSSTPEGYLVLRELHSAAHIWGGRGHDVLPSPRSTFWGTCSPSPTGFTLLLTVSLMPLPHSIQSVYSNEQLLFHCCHGMALCWYSRAGMTWYKKTINPQNYNLTTLKSRFRTTGNFKIIKDSRWIITWPLWILSTWNSYHTGHDHWRQKKLIVCFHTRNCTFMW